MGKILKITLALLCCFLLGACHTEPSKPRLVTKVSITDSAGITRNYLEPRKMEVFLYYLRSLNPTGKPTTDLERIIGESYRICVEFSDGQTSIYRQRANRFLSRDSHPWQNIDPKKASMLRPLLDGIAQG